MENVNWFCYLWYYRTLKSFTREKTNFCFNILFCSQQWQLTNDIFKYTNKLWLLISSIFIFCGIPILNYPSKSVFHKLKHLIDFITEFTSVEFINFCKTPIDQILKLPDIEQCSLIQMSTQKINMTYSQKIISHLQYSILIASFWIFDSSGLQPLIDWFLD